MGNHKPILTDKEVAIRTSFSTFSRGERDRCLAHIREHLADEGFVDLTDVEVDQILLARATGGLPFDGLPEAPTQQHEPQQPEPAVDDDCDLSDLLRGCCPRCAE